jgi:hypothetical protein
MDIISHGLQGGITFGRSSRRSYLLAFLFGILPDLLSFGILTILSVLRISQSHDWESGPPDPSSIPQYVHSLYNITHSFVTAGVVIGLVWLLRGKPLTELFAWPLHILVDIPTHSSRFFPTPFLWPFTDYRVNGISWGTPYIFIPNIVIILLLYSFWYIRTKKR